MQEQVILSFKTTWKSINPANPSYINTISVCLHSVNLQRFKMWLLSGLIINLIAAWSLEVKYYPLEKKICRTTIDFREFNEIYRPINETEPPLLYLLSINTLVNFPYVSLNRFEYHREGTCQDSNRVYWNYENMSFRSMDKSGCSFHFDWPTTLFYFNDNLTLGILIEGSLLNKTRHVLSYQEFRQRPIPSKREVQDLVMHYEGDFINLEDTNEGFSTFIIGGTPIPNCSCSNNFGHPFSFTNQLGSFQYIFLAIILLYFIVVIVYGML